MFHLMLTAWTHRISSGTGTPVPNGFTVDEAKSTERRTCKRAARICAWEIVEVNPTLDTENRMAESGFEVLEATSKSIGSTTGDGGVGKLFFLGELDSLCP
jgi:hypothetical protein